MKRKKKRRKEKKRKEAMKKGLVRIRLRGLRRTEITLYH